MKLIDRGMMDLDSLSTRDRRNRRIDFVILPNFKTFVVLNNKLYKFFSQYSVYDTVAKSK